MRNFYRRALQKIGKLNTEQLRDLLGLAAGELDRLETVLDSLTEGVLVCDKAHSLLLSNKYAERFLPLDHPIEHHEHGNTPIWTAIRDEKVADFLRTSLLNGDRQEGREFDVEAGGIQRLLSIGVFPLVRERQVTGSLIRLEDITEKRGREARLRRAENLASLTTLAAGVAHEIKNPLGSISIHIQLIQKAVAANKEFCAKVYAEQSGGEDGGIPECARLMDKYIGVVNEEIDRLNHIVVDFLFAVRPMHMDLRDGNINILIGELMEFVRYELDEAHIAAHLDLAENIPLAAFDERYMKQALLNLIKNAIAAMNRGGTLSVKTCVKDAEIIISVKDTGVGIPEENLSKIFEPYFTTKETGSGLGLTLVFKIIREHQGEITVKSRKGEGTCFFITLPIPQKERRLIAFEEGEG